jgi:hypothetical protein
MTTRLTANLVLFLALGAVAAGCTVHTYSARPEYPSAAFARSEPTRYEASYRSDRSSRDRESDRAETYTPTYRPATHRPSTGHTSTTRRDRDRAAQVATRDRETTGTVRDTKPRNPASSSASQNSGTAQKPRETKDREHVTLVPVDRDKPTTKTKTNGRPLSFEERLKLLVEKQNQEGAKQEKSRAARMRAIGDAVKND